MTASNIPFHHFGGKGETIHFAHANGFPPEAYQQFISPFLAHHQVIASKWRPLWGNRNPKEVKSWWTFADDLIQFMDEHQLKNVIGIGHSMGGAISIAAASKRPDLFKKLILIDPVIASFRFWMMSKITPNSIIKKNVPIIKGSIQRKDKWNSREEVYEQWRNKKVFRKFSDDVLGDLVEHAIIPKSDGNFTLAYPKAWETQVYLTVPYVFSKMMKLKIPITVFRGAKGSVITPKLWKKWQNQQPSAKFVNFEDAGHLIPFEYPKELSHMILEDF